MVEGDDGKGRCIDDQLLRYLQAPQHWRGAPKLSGCVKLMEKCALGNRHVHSFGQTDQLQRGRAADFRVCHESMCARLTFRYCT
jgi:hypothetical protein